MVEITGDDLALLRDDDLRTLVGRLCEEEVRKLGFATSTFTWEVIRTPRMVASTFAQNCLKA
jgi:hypothetical protein